ncbi:MAG: DUF6194 family protein [Propionibacteriales bacterium]|nr:DUF6194 family protein [Propionibacteriales bacterium]
MSMQQILDELRSYDGILELAPTEGSQFPELAWGDHFFYYAPDGKVPTNRQPFATIVTKDYPDDQQSRLDPEGRWRLNIHVGARRRTDLTGGAATDPATEDVIIDHPGYGAMGWVAVVNPGAASLALMPALLRAAYEDDRRRVERR